jgi:hypothetical protein
VKRRSTRRPFNRANVYSTNPGRQRQLRLSQFSETDISRFWEKVRANLDNFDAHWTWKGATDRDGHGRFKVRGKVEYAHRVAWALVNGSTPPKRMVLHDCGIPNCVNPNHLYAGNHSENALDYWRDKQRRGAA